MSVATLVLDASYAIALALQEGEIPGVDEVAGLVARGGAIVPPLWRWEVANALVFAARKRRIAPSRPAEILADLEALPIRLDEVATRRAWTATLTLAERHGLTVYDAAYLELALRLERPLASLDADLIAAASREGVRAIGA